MLDQIISVLTTQTQMLLEALGALLEGLSTNSMASRFIAVLDTGGPVMWVLLLAGLLLWYAIGARVLLLGVTPIDGARSRVKRLLKRPDARKRGLLDHAAADAVAAAKMARRINGSQRGFIEECIVAYKSRLRRYSVMIKALVLTAPLTGLLGTVIGMIETFEALETMSVFSQSSSIAGGISTAMFTTQMGLVVAIPGLLVGQVLERRQLRLVQELNQIQLLVTAVTVR